MRGAGMTQNAIAEAMNVTQSVASRLLNKHRETGYVKDRPRTVRQKLTNQR